jgi:hypothetical protein
VAGSGKIFHRSEKDPIWGLKGRRRYCKYYQAGLLTSQQIWQALDQFYANNYPEYHPAWQNAYPQPLKTCLFWLAVKNLTLHIASVEVGERS